MMNSCSDSSNEIDSMEVKPDLHMNLGVAAAPLPPQPTQERYVWEMRTRSPNITPASTVLNSPDLNAELSYAPLHQHHHHHHYHQNQQQLQLLQEQQHQQLQQQQQQHQYQHQHQQLPFINQSVQSVPSHQTESQHLPYLAQPPQSSYYYQRPHHPHHQIRVGRSPGSQFESHDLPQGLTSPGSPTDVGKGDGQCLRDGEIVVFDDIDTNWMNKPATAAAATTTAITAAQASAAAAAAAGQVNSTTVASESNHDDVLKVTKMIGQLPIAEYEGSPRRFGSHPMAMTKAGGSGNGGGAGAGGGGGGGSLPKRPPGFPQRVSPSASSTTNANTNTNNHTKTSMGNLIDLIDHEAVPAAMEQTKSAPFDYLYEFSETRKVLEEFFKANPDDEKRFAGYTTTESGDDVASLDTQQDYGAVRVNDESKHIEQAYIGQRLARLPKDELYMVHRSPRKQQQQQINNLNNASYGNEHNDIELYIDSNSRSSGDLADTELEANLRRHSRNFTLSPETTDYDSNCGDLDSLSNDINCTTDYGKLYTSMPVLEDGLSSGHASDTENNVSVVCEKQVSSVVPSSPVPPPPPPPPATTTTTTEHNGNSNSNSNSNGNASSELSENEYNASLGGVGQLISDFAVIVSTPTSTAVPSVGGDIMMPTNTNTNTNANTNISSEQHNSSSPTITHYYAGGGGGGGDTATNSNCSPTPPPPTPAAPAATPASQRPNHQGAATADTVEIEEAMKEIRSALQRAKSQPDKLKYCDEVLPIDPSSPVWVPRKGAPPTSSCPSHARPDDEEADTDLETDRLLGQQRHDDHDHDHFFATQSSPVLTGGGDSNANGLTGSDNNSNPKPLCYSSATIRQGIGTSLTPNSPDICQIVGMSDISITTPEKLQYTKSPTGSIKSLKDSVNSDKKSKTRNKEGLLEPKVLIEGVLFRARYLGSTQLVCEGQPTKSTRMMQAEEAVSRIKAPEGESQPSTEVDLFISTEKIMVLNTDLKEIMMDHALRTISYIADIGDLVVLMARRRFIPNGGGGGSGNVTTTTLGTGTTTTTGTSVGDTGIVADNNGGELNELKENCIKENNSAGGGGGGGGSCSGNGSNKHNRTPKMICHVFESDEAQFIAQSIGQAFQVAYMEFLKANGIENENLAKEMDYQEVLNSQEIFGDELEIFAKKELQKEVVVPKAKGEILGVVIVESGWGSMLPTVVIANLMSGGAAARCGQLNIGDQLIAINGMSLVGLPLSTCQSYIRNAKNQTAVKFTVVPCPPVVEVKILRPKALFQLGFSVQNGVICSLLRGGIAERGGVRVGHRIIEINNQSVVAVPHDTIVKLLSSSVGEILMKTMPTSMFRLLTGQETPIYI